MTETAPATSPSPAPSGDAAPAAGTPEAAQAELAALSKDRSWVEKFAAGDATVRAQSEALHKAAYPPTEEEAVAIEAAEAVPAKALPIEFEPNTSVEDAAAMHKLANETVVALGLDAELAHGGLQRIQDSIVARGKRVMSDMEFDRCDEVLKQALGDKLGEHMKRFAAAIKDAGEGGQWLKRALSHCAPEVAAWAIISVATAGAEKRR